VVISVTLYKIDYM